MSDIRRRQPAIKEMDLVTLLDPRPIIQLDYDVTVRSLANEIINETSLIDFSCGMHLDDLSTRRLASIVAADRLAKMKKSGLERKLILGDPFERLRGKQFTVISRKVKMTGLWCPASYSGDYYREDYDPPYLSYAKSIVCYELLTDANPNLDEFHWPYYGFWVTKSQVEKVTDRTAQEEN